MVHSKFQAISALEKGKKGIKKAAEKLFAEGMKKEPGIDGILVTVGLCIIALLLCVVMKDSLADFIQKIVGAMTSEAEEVLRGVTP